MTQDKRRRAVEDALKRLPIHPCTCDGCIMYGLGWYCQALCALTAQERVVLAAALTRPEPDWRDDVVRALRAVLPENWGVVKMNGAVSVYTPTHDRVCWFLESWREGCGKHAIMAVVAEYLDKHPREGV